MINRENNRGFTYIALLLAIVIIGISLSAAGRYWKFIDQKDKEDELLFRGDQFVRAIDAYFRSAHGGANIYPKSFDVMLKDPRSLAPRRYLRRLYKDPMTGKADWEPIVEPQSGRIKGVKSRSTGRPIKTDRFPKQYEGFREKGSYSEWEFLHKPGMFK